MVSSFYEKMSMSSFLYESTTEPDTRNTNEIIVLRNAWILMEAAFCLLWKLSLNCWQSDNIIQRLNLLQSSTCACTHPTYALNTVVCLFQRSHNSYSAKKSNVIFVLWKIKIYQYLLKPVKPATIYRFKRWHGSKKNGISSIFCFICVWNNIEAKSKHRLWKRIIFTRCNCIDFIRIRILTTYSQNLQFRQRSKPNPSSKFRFVSERNKKFFFFCWYFAVTFCYVYSLLESQ